MKSFRTHGGEAGAEEYVENLVKDLAKGSQVTAVRPAKTADLIPMPALSHPSAQ